MGNCSTPEQQPHPIRKPPSSQPQPEKLMLFQNPETLMVVLSNGSVENIGTSQPERGLALSMFLQPGLYLGDKNKVYFMVQGESLNEQPFLQMAHAYHLAKHSCEVQLIAPSKIYLLRKQEQYILIAESKPLGEDHCKFVDLKDLGRKLRLKNIGWQDMEFKELITRFCRKYSKLTNKDNHKISNIIIGNDGSLHLLGVFQPTPLPSQARIEALKELWLESLYGCNTANQSLAELEGACKFKHPGSLHSISNLQARIEEERSNKYEVISNPELKFIKDYIRAYHYQLDTFHLSIVNVALALKQWHRAKQLLDSHMAANNSFSTITKQNYKLYHMLHKIECGIDENSPGAIESSVRISAAAGYLALKAKDNNQYFQSFGYYNQCLQFTKSKKDEEFYIGMAEVCRALYLNQQTEQTLLSGLRLYPNNRVLNLLLIIHLCDCMRIDEVQKMLTKDSSASHTLQAQLGSAKLFLTKALISPQSKLALIQKSRDILTNIALQKEALQNNGQPRFHNYTLPLYHEIMGDFYFQEKNLDKAKQEYCACKTLLKNQKACGFRIASITAAEANCHLMQNKFDESIATYNEALQYPGEDCKNLKDTIIGSRAIAKVKKGLKKQGETEIEELLNATLPSTLQRDYNYIFLHNFLNNCKNQ